MKSIGIVREVDKLGRIVIPKELRRTMKMDSGDLVEIFVEGDSMVLRNYRPSCIFCGSSEMLGEFRGKPVCAACINDMRNK
ncbi:MAG: AbrB/MazE/SpoVT family DNA-binding domain-containing protein [Clostridia bacterium]|nr:AbrB/MazE/SpoVT family DNA-binding domain-containing protein [Clostridia bacterium]